MAKYIKPEFTIKSLTQIENISVDSGLSTWLEKEYIDPDVGISTYQLSSM